MNAIQKAYRYIKQKYQTLHVKKYTTLAGTLVFFFVMSLLPLSFWLTLLLGKLPIPTDRLLQLPVFQSVEKVFTYVKTEAENATAGVSVLLIITTLYSSTNLFYQMKRSGEIIYEVEEKRQGLRLRLSAIGLMCWMLLLILGFLTVYGVAVYFFSQMGNKFWERVFSYALLIILAFAIVLFVNVYVCPYKCKWTIFLPGSFLTVLSWSVAVVGFGFYLKISNLDKLYGALSAIIVFLLWLYILMICLVVGIIFNSERVIKAQKKNKKKKSA